ncbi:MAG: response regulator, partial [Lachnospiraceae bacterium]|nr:response regulator [Lachnospiraceae bacterium]
MSNNKKVFKEKRGFLILVSFIAILLVIGIFLGIRLNNLIIRFVESNVKLNATELADKFGEQIDADFNELTAISKYIEKDYGIKDRLVYNSSVSGTYSVMGLIDINGETVAGDDLDRSLYYGVQESLRGYKKVIYSESEGMLLTVPVYSNENVRYVLYRLYPVSKISERYGIECYDGQGTVGVVDSNWRLTVPLIGAPDHDLFYSEEFVDTYREIVTDLAVNKSASTYLNTDNGDYYLFGADVDEYELRVCGYVPKSVVSKGVSIITGLVIWVFGLMFLMIVIGSVFINGAEARYIEDDAIKKAKDEADKANRAKSDFLANMSHEIRTPINAIMGMDEMILRDTKEKSTKEYANLIKKSSNALLVLINDILDFSKIEAGKMELVESEYSLSDTISDAINMVDIKLKQKNLQFDIDVDNNLPNRLYGDGPRLRQAIVNILNNAAKYTTEGSVTLKVTGELLFKEVKLRISIIDTGIGIKKDDISKLFSNFERLDLKHNRTIEGTGLGLSLTQKLIGLMGGNIEVDSEFGVGSTFTINVPQAIASNEIIGDFYKRHEEHKEYKDEIKKREFYIAPKAKVLAVDDNDMNLVVIKKLLRYTQIRVTTALSGAECLKLVERERFDVILLDHMMPVMDGLETLKKIRSMTDFPCESTPIVALTANAIVGSREKYLEAGFDDYMSKPVNGQKLEELLLKYIPSKKITFVSEEELKAQSTKPAESGSDGESNEQGAEEVKVEAPKDDKPAKRVVINK